MRKGPVVVVLALAGVALAGSAALPVLRELAAARGPKVPTYEVTRDLFDPKIHAEGNLQAVDATLLGPPPEVPEALRIAWLAPDGSRVEEGDVVIRFDPSEMEESLRNGRHDRDTAESKISGREVREEGSRNNLERDADMAALELDYAQSFQTKDERIFSRTEIIESEIDQGLASQKKEHASEAGRIHSALAQAELDLLTIERRKAEIKIEQAEKGLQALEVRAPHPGIFVLKQQWGRIPEVGQMVWGGNPVAEIPKLQSMEAKVYVLEADAGGLEAGLRASVVIEAHPDEIYPATVKKVDALAQKRNRRVPVQYFGVTLELDTTDPELMKPGQRVRAVIQLPELDAVVSVPRQAVFEDEGKKIVYLRGGGAFEPVEVTLGSTSLSRVVIEKGLEVGDVISLRDPTRPIAEPAEEATSSGPATPVGS